MNAVRGAALATVCACVAACGDPNSLGGVADGVSGSSGTGGGGSGGVGGDAGGSSDEVTLRMDRFVVEPGREAFACQTFANPFGGSEVYLREFESHMSPGSHHLVVNYAQGVTRDGTLTSCSGLAPPVGPFTTQGTHDIFTFQQGVAARLPGTDGLTLISHYFNASSVPLTAEVSVTLRRARAESVEKVAWLQTMSYVDITVPPRQTLTVQGGLTLPQDSRNRTFDVLWIQSHMHSRGTRFAVSAGPGGANVIYETDRWEAPSHKVDPPYQLNPGDSLNYSCTFFNKGDFPLTFGESAATNEMCLLVYHYTTSDNMP